MKTALIGTILTLVSAHTAASQTACPIITVVGPHEITVPGQIMNFRAEISAPASDARVTYEWKLSGGQTFDGQGTDRIRIQTTREDESRNVTATVLIRGLAEGCVTGASETAAVASILNCEWLERYGRIPWPDEQARLDNFRFLISQNPGYSGFIHMQIKSRDSVDSAKKHARRMLKHFKWRDKNFDAGRLWFAIEITGDGPFTSFQVIPAGIPLPNCGNACILFSGKDL